METTYVILVAVLFYMYITIMKRSCSSSQEHFTDSDESESLQRCRDSRQELLDNSDRLKNEVNALKQKLQSKTDEMENLEEVKQSLTQQLAELNLQIDEQKETGMQKRLKDLQLELRSCVEEKSNYDPVDSSQEALRNCLEKQQQTSNLLGVCQLDLEQNQAKVGKLQDEIGELESKIEICEVQKQKTRDLAQAILDSTQKKNRSSTIETGSNTGKSTSMVSKSSLGN